MGKHFERGRVLFNLKRYREAISAYEAELAEHPNNAWAHACLGAAYINLRRFKDADRAVRQAISIAPQLAYAYYVLSFVEQNRNRLAAAEIAIEEAARLEHSADWFCRWAQIAVARKKWDEALAATGEALRIDPTHGPSMLLRGQLLARVGRLPDAHALFVQALATNPEDAKAQQAAGSLLLRRGDAEGALGMLREARRLDPNAANDARSIEVAYGRLLWPFRWINRYVYRWQDAPPKRRWLYFTLLATVFGFGGLIVGSHGKGVQQTNVVWTPICVFLINYAIAAVTLDYLAASVGAMFLRREFGMRWYAVMWRPIVVAPLVIAHLVGIPIGLLASYEPCVGVMTCELALCFPFLAESVQSSRLRLTGYICLPLMFVLMIDGTIGAITFDYESPLIGLIVLLPFFGITYFADNITHWAGRVAFQRSPLLKESSKN